MNIIQLHEYYIIKLAELPCFTHGNKCLSLCQVKLLQKE